MQSPSSHADIEAVSGQPYDSYLAQRTVWEALAASTARWGERTALTYITSPELEVAALRWSYRELLEQVVRAANVFHACAQGQPPRVAMLLPNIPQAWFTMLGAETAGVVCPINYLLGPEHVAELVEATGANILVALGPNDELDIGSRAEAVRKRCPQVRVLVVGGSDPEEDFEAALARVPGDRLQFAPPAGRDAIAALFHTGGTTGRPKLAQHAHGNQLHAARGAAHMYGMTEQDVMLNGFPLFHVAGAFVYGLSTLMAGAELVLPTLLGMRNKRFVERYWHFVERHGVTLLAVVPTVMSMLVGSSPTPAQTAGVRAMLTGGSPLPDELADACERALSIPVRNIFGMTECAGVISIEPVAAPRVRGSCGFPLPHTQVRTVDADGAFLPAGASGILAVSGPNVVPGYTESERNAGTFSDGWLLTGDIGQVGADGRVYITGRAKDVIVRSGHNIDPRLIEDALMRHPAILLAAAVGEPDEYAGELPVAYAVLKEGAAAEAQQVLEFAREFIPERPAWPKRLEFVPSLPQTAVGKIFKPALREAAVLRALAERLERAGLGAQVRPQAREEGGVSTIVFATAPGTDAGATQQAIKAMMQPFALRYRIEPASF